MESREILIANTKTQKRSKVTTNATTLGELKAALDAAGIDYEGMTFTEGISKTQLLDDTTPLPKDVMYKGSPTNNLVILLTNTKKNIASGFTGSRKDAYEIIKENNFMQGIQEEFGYNYTNVSTTDLWNYIDAHLGEGEQDEDDDMFDEEDNVKEPETLGDVMDIIFNGIDHLSVVKASYEDRVAVISIALHKLAKILEQPKPTTIAINGSELSEDDIDDMIASL